MRAGALRHSVIIQTSTPSQSGTGEVTESWGTFATVKASISPSSGREFFASEQLNAEMSHKVKIRYLSGVTTKMRVLFGSRVLDILSIVNIDEKNHEMILMCKEFV